MFVLMKLQAEEDGHYGYEYGFLDDGIDSDSDPDYGTKKKKKLNQKKQKAKAVDIAPPKIDAIETESKELPENDASMREKSASQELGFSATGRRKRKDTGATRTASRAWDDEEEAKFKEALSLYGRDWKKCAEHIGTRDARAVASHTQKFLIKALLRREELPGEMAKSGRGYTLSGKPLDPNSSAARAYGLRPKEFMGRCSL